MEKLIPARLEEYMKTVDEDEEIEVEFWPSQVYTYKEKK